MEVRRGEETGADSGGGQHPGDHRRRGRLPFAAGDVDDALPALRIAEAVKERARAVEVPLEARPVEEGIGNESGLQRAAALDLGERQRVRA
jgi:hypothetical protein